MRSIATFITSFILVMGLMVSPGCRKGESGNSILGGLGAGGLADGLSGAAGADSDVAAAIGAGVGFATAVAIDIIEEREATTEERQNAQQQANKQLEPVGEQERQNLKEQNTYVAVPVAESEEDGTEEVMVVDPVTGEPVNDTVYVVDASDPNASSGEKVDLGGYDAIYVE